MVTDLNRVKKELIKDAPSAINAEEFVSTWVQSSGAVITNTMPVVTIL